MENEARIQAAIDQVLKKKPDVYKSVKDYLYRVKDAERKVSLIEERIRYKKEAIGAHGVCYGESISGGTDYKHSSVENAVMGLDDLNDELQEAKKAYADTKVEVSDFITELEDINQQMVVTKKYICGQDWEKIATDMGMSSRTVQRIHGRALPILQEAFDLKKAS